MSIHVVDVLARDGGGGNLEWSRPFDYYQNADKRILQLTTFPGSPHCPLLQICAFLIIINIGTAP